MVAWFDNLRHDWDAVLALALAWIVIAVALGPVYYFLLLYVLSCTCVIRMALRR
jgi:hypothetical protein